MRNLIAPQTSKFTSRPGDPRLADLIHTSFNPSQSVAIGILGCPDDTGVKLNGGRAGAALGPDSIRKHLYRMTPSMDFTWPENVLADFGNLEIGEDILSTQSRARELSEALYDHADTIIFLGGGHDFAAPNYLGFLEAMGFPAKKVGLINVDPHLDVREFIDGKPHSGSPFRQILESRLIRPQHFIQFGARKNRNAASHFKFCEALGVPIETYDDIRLSPRPAAKLFERYLKSLLMKCSAVGVTIDMDGCCQVEGTSAAPVIGFSANDLFSIAEISGSFAKVKYFEIAEVAPTLDSTERSSRLAAELIFAFVDARLRKAKTRRNK